MRILVPLDGSELSELVFPWVRLLASKGENQIELMRSYRPLQAAGVVTEITMVATEIVRDCGVAAHVKGELDRLAERLTEFNVATSSVVGQAADSILRSSDFADLIVMASHGESGVTRWLLGSITTKVVRASVKPVLVVTANPEAPPRVPKLEKILVPMDGSSTAEIALSQAVKYAQSFDAKLVLYESVHCREGRRDEDDWQCLLAEGYLREQAGALSGLEVETVVQESNQGVGIVEHAEKLDVDMIVMGSHGRSGISRWVLGSVAESVVQKSSCPVMLVYDR